MSAAARQRKLDNQAGAVAGLAVLRPDAAADSFRDLARDRESEAGVLAEAVLARPLGVEAVEDSLEIVRRNAWAFVLHTHLRAAVGRAGRDGHRAAVRTERHGIVDQVAEDLAQALVIAQHGGTGGEIGLEREADAAGKLGQTIDLDPRAGQ